MPGDRFIEIAQADGLRVLESLFGRVEEGVTVQQVDGHLVYANDHAARMLGCASARELVTTPVDRLLGAYEMVDESGEPFSRDRFPGRRVLAGESLAEETVGLRHGLDDVRWIRIRATPIRNDSGSAVWALNFFHDVTSAIRRTAAERLVAGANQILGSSLDVQGNLEALAEVLVPEMAEWCGVHLLDEYEQLSQVAAKYPPSPAAESLLEMTSQRHVDVNAESLPAGVLRTASAMTFNDLSDDVLNSSDVAVADLIHELDIAAVTCHPVGPPGRPIGTLTLARTTGRRRFDHLDLEVLDDVARAIGSAVVNARLYEQEHRIATLLSRSLLPRPPERVAGLRIATRHRSSVKDGGLGGDFVETIAIEDGSVAVLVADIEGKGIAATAAVGVVKHTFRAVVRVDPSPDVVVSMINDALLDQEHRRMCTFAYLWLQRTDGRPQLTVTVAGHPPPVLIRDGEIVEMGEPCPPAGLLPEIAPNVHVESLASGDTIIVYTDGYSLRHQLPPETMITNLRASPAHDLDALVDELLARLDADGDAVVDDVVILGLQIPKGD